MTRGHNIKVGGLLAERSQGYGAPVKRTQRWLEWTPFGLIVVLNIAGYQGASAYIALYAAGALVHPPSVLAHAAAMRHAGGDWAAVASASNIGLVIIALAALAQWRPPRILRFHHLMAIASLALLGTSVLTGSSGRAGIWIVCGLTLAAGLSLRPETIRPALFAVAVAWSAVSLLHGTETPGNFRFVGITDNPNLFSAVTLVLLAYSITTLTQRTATRGWRTQRLLAASTSTLLIYLLLRTDSDQALVGLVLLAVILTLHISRSLQVPVGPFVFLAIGTGVLLSVMSMAHFWSEDISLSGRTRIFVAGWSQVIDHPIFGTGDPRVSTGSNADLATHSALLTFGLAGGVPGALLWAAALLATLMAAWRFNKMELILSATAIVAIQLVQNIEWMPLTWLIIGLIGTDERRTNEDPVDRQQLYATRGWRRTADTPSPYATG